MPVKPRGRVARVRGSSSFSPNYTWQGIYLIGFIILLSILPNIVSFIYSVIKDPDTPQLMNRIKEKIKEMTVKKLSEDEDKKEP